MEFLLDLVSLPGEYQGLTRGQATSAVEASLKGLGLYRGVEEVREEVLLTKYGDVVCLRDIRDFKKEEGDINLRKPVLLVSINPEGPIVSCSSNVNIEASDNKAVGEVGGRTGAFCTGCTATEADMHGEKASQVFENGLAISRISLNEICLLVNKFWMVGVYFYSRCFTSIWALNKCGSTTRLYWTI